MSLLKSVLGGAIGFMVGGPIGAILGASIAYQFGNNTESNSDTEQSSQAQMAFFVATFAVMGHVAKVDGRVRPQAIRFAEQVMSDMNLDAQLRATAINLFQQGKKADFQLNPVLTQFYQECQFRSDLRQRFLSIQLQTAIADGALSSAEDAMLWQVCNHLRISRLQYEQTKIQLFTQQYFHQQKNYTASTTQTSSLSEAYQVLGLTSAASPIEIKKAYRRLMSRHHPDKLAAKGLSEEAMRVAKEKTQQISKAYETLQKQGKV
jgi:DnaJ like chaperone protein